MDLQISLEEAGLLYSECTCIILLECFDWLHGGSGPLVQLVGVTLEVVEVQCSSSCVQNFIKLNVTSPTPLPSVQSPLHHTFSAATHSVGVAKSMRT